MLAAVSLRRARGHQRRGRGGWWPAGVPRQRAAAPARPALPVEVVGSEVTTLDEDRPWCAGGIVVPPQDIRQRMSHTCGMMGKHILAYVGDTVWEYLVLKHQYMQVVRSPFTESQAVRSLKQAKAAAMLWRGRLLTSREKEILKWATAQAWKKKLLTNRPSVEQVGHEQYSAAAGLRGLLGYLYLDTSSDDSRLEEVAREVGIFAEAGEEDQMLAELTEGEWKPQLREPTTFFLALAPLGHVALRLYISRYFCQRPLRDEEFIYRVKLAVREEELDLAAVGFMRDDATKEELQLMRAARDQRDTYAFAFECLLGHLALNKPYRLHQILANFGWAVPLAGT